MGTNIKVNIDVLNSLSNDYRRYGQEVHDTYKTASSRIERELEPILRKYSSYSSVTRNVYELQSRLKRTEQSVRELRDRSDELGRGLKNAADMYRQQQEKEKQLISRYKTSTGNLSVAAVNSRAAINIPEKINAVLDKAGNLRNQGIGAASSSVSSIIGGIGKKVDAVYTSIGNTLAGTAGKVKTSIGNFAENTRRTAVGFAENVKSKLNAFPEQAGAFFKKTGDVLADFYGKFKEGVKELYKKIAETVQKLIDYIKENKESIISGLKQVGIVVLDTVQFILDIAGLIPGIGELADGANALIYTLRGDYVNAGLSVAACIPFAGWAATAGKIGSKIAKAIDKIGDVSKIIDKVRDLAKYLEKAKAIGAAGLKHGDSAIKFITKKGDEVWSLIKNSAIVRKASDMIAAISQKGYEIQEAIGRQAENWWARQCQIGIVPPNVADFINGRGIKSEVKAGAEIADEAKAIKTVSGVEVPEVSDVIEGVGKFDINVKPNVSNQKLQNIVDDLYKGQGGKNTIGNGTTMDAVRNELQTSLPTNGKFHTQKLNDYLNALQRRLRAGDLNSYDKSVVNALIEDINKALSGQ